LADEDDPSGRERALPQIIRDRDTVAQQMVETLGPGDRVRPTIGRAGRMHHAKYRDAVAQQRDRHGRAAMAVQERAGAVVGIDQPAEGRAGHWREAGLLAAPGCR
jgi:hypothetical protein